ncbi:uncharacterized protein ABDE67_020831 [Symphorus nematophorus]
MNDPNTDLQDLIRKDEKTKDQEEPVPQSSHSTFMVDDAAEALQNDREEPTPQSSHSTFMVDDTAEVLQNESDVYSFPEPEAPPEVADLPLPDLNPEYAAIHEIPEEETPEGDAYMMLYQ